MSEFHCGVKKGIKFETTPCGIRKFFLFRKFPYWAGDKAIFKIKIHKVNESDKLISMIAVMKAYPNRSKSGLHLDKSEYTINESCDEMIITSSTIYGSEPLEYWLGTPYFDGSEKVADLQGSWKDQFIWFTIAPAIVGFFISIFFILLAWALGAIQVNVQWIARLF